MKGMGPKMWNAFKRSERFAGQKGQYARPAAHSDLGQRQSSKHSCESRKDEGTQFDVGQDTETLEPEKRQTRTQSSPEVFAAGAIHPVVFHPLRGIVRGLVFGQWE